MRFIHPYKAEQLITSRMAEGFLGRDSVSRHEVSRNAVVEGELLQPPSPEQVRPAIAQVHDMGSLSVEKRGDDRGAETAQCRGTLAKLPELAAHLNNCALKQVTAPLSRGRRGGTAVLEKQLGKLFD